MLNSTKWPNRGFLFWPSQNTKRGAAHKRVALARGSTIQEHFVSIVCILVVLQERMLQNASYYRLLDSRKAIEDV